MATALQSNKNGIKSLSNGNSNNHMVEQVEEEEEDSACGVSKGEVCETNGVGGEMQSPEAAAGAEGPEIDIVINNVVCSFTVRCHLNLRQIALEGCNVEYKRENGMVTMKLRKPYTTASLWSSGKVTVTGATSEPQAHVAARRIARQLQCLGFKARFANYRVVNVLGTCSMPFNIKIVNFSERFRKVASYEPELHPGVTYRIKESPKATLKIFSTGSITVTAPSVLSVQAAIEHIYPLVYEFRTERTAEQISRMKHQAELKRMRGQRGSRSKPIKHVVESDDDEFEDEENEEEDEESFDSCD